MDTHERTLAKECTIEVGVNLADLNVTDITALSGKALREAYQEVMQSPPPSRASRHFLRGNIAWVLQVRQQNQDQDKLAQSLLRKLDKVISPHKNQPQHGTRLVREWQGKVHEVLVLEDSYRYRGEDYRSLSRIASVITGAHWSGPRFFGLTKGGAGKRSSSRVDEAPSSDE